MPDIEETNVAKARVAHLLSSAGETVPDSDKEQLASLAETRLALYETGIINAIPRERAAIAKVFGKAAKLPVNAGKLSYDVCELVKDNETTSHLVIANIAGQGTIQTATATASLAQRLPYLKSVVLVGIAAGQPQTNSEEKDVYLGDIVVGESLVQYDHIKRATGKKAECRGQNINLPSPSMLGVARGLLSDMEETPQGPWKWEETIKAAAANWPAGKRPAKSKDAEMENRKYKRGSHRVNDTRPHVRIGKIGSANLLLKDANFRDELAAEHNTIAYEMEGAGLAIAAPEFNLQYLIVRGICDYGDDRKNDDWQPYAALAAAAVAKTILERL